jgi:hypothetical protein
LGNSSAFSGGSTSALERIGEDIPEWDIVASIVDYYPQSRPYYYGQLTWETTYSLIPRRIWQSKPIWYGPYQIENDVFPGQLVSLPDGGFEGTFLSSSTLGAGYAEFGWVGALAAMFIFGAMWRLLYGLVESRRPDFVRAALFGFCWSGMPILVRYFSLAISSLTMNLGIYMFIFAALKTRGHHVQVPVTEEQRERQTDFRPRGSSLSPALLPYPSERRPGPTFFDV